eukprot:scaffold307485_cov31-Tisochrysis_lutea.AAC.2
MRWAEEPAVEAVRAPLRPTCLSLLAASDDALTATSEAEVAQSLQPDSAPLRRMNRTRSTSSSE